MRTYWKLPRLTPDPPRFDAGFGDPTLVRGLRGWSSVPFDRLGQVKLERHSWCWRRVLALRLRLPAPLSPPTI